MHVQNGKELRMLVRKVSDLTGIQNEMDLPVTIDQLNRYRNREGLLQDIFPDLPGPEREFIKSGITPDEWIETFGVCPRKQKAKGK